jgi:hypothetical protein
MWVFGFNRLLDFNMHCASFEFGALFEVHYFKNSVDDHLKYITSLYLGQPGNIILLFSSLLLLISIFFFIDY